MITVLLTTSNTDTARYLKKLLHIACCRELAGTFLGREPLRFLLGAEVIQRGTSLPSSRPS